MISIIIPAYNAAKYIERSLRSCIQQDYEEVEILIVNDGSSDNTVEIVERFIQYDSRIRLINKLNGGLVSARKEGLNYVLGDYVFFLDADDYLEEDTLSILSQYCGQYDIIISDFILENERGKIMPLQHRNIDKYGSDLLGYLKNYLSKSVTASLCGRLIKTELLKDFSTPLDLTIGEDVVTNMIILQKYNPSIKIINKNLYHYVQYSTSMVNSKNKESLLQRVVYVTWVIEFIEKMHIVDYELHDQLSYLVLDEFYIFLRDGGQTSYCLSFVDRVYANYWQYRIVWKMPIWRKIILISYRFSPYFSKLFVSLLNFIRIRIK